MIPRRCHKGHPARDGRCWRELRYARNPISMLCVLAWIHAACGGDDPYPTGYGPTSGAPT